MIIIMINKQNLIDCFFLIMFVSFYNNCEILLQIVKL